MDKSRYPKNWDEISKEIRVVRARNLCEKCGVPNHATIVRKPKTDEYLLVEAEGYRWPDGRPIPVWVDQPPGFNYNREIKVVLTVHHIGVPYPDGRPGDPHDKMDVRPENLIALCQKHHLEADLPVHIANAKRTRQRKKAAARETTGQQTLF